MAIKYDPYIGLTYDGVHSSELGLVRVSDGSRYNENLLPSFSDKTAERTGTDGTYYFGAEYKQKDWSIEFAFDHVTKKQLREIKQLFGKGSKKPLKLVFDEDRNYSDNGKNSGEPKVVKYYMAKVAQPPQIKTLCFDEEVDGEKVEIFKGELTVEFISYNGYGYGMLNRYEITAESQEGENFEGGVIGTFVDSEGKLNQGDMSAYPVIFIQKDGIDKISTINLYISRSSGTIQSGEYSYVTNFLRIEDLTIPTDNCGIVIDFEKGIITGLKTELGSEETIEGKLTSKIDDIEYLTDGKIYNSSIVSGGFFDVVPEKSDTYKIEFSIVGESAHKAVVGFKKIITLRERHY